jgi:hypothetical protein
MRITESMLRSVIREEIGRLNEADNESDVDEEKAKAAVDKLFRVKKKEFPGPAKNTTSGVAESARSTCKYELRQAGVTDVASYVKKYAPGGDDMGEAAAVEKMNESQRGIR